jgi:uncharacterized GH25 family protein
VAGWLCSAARLTALNARKARSRRDRKEASARPPQRNSPAPLDQMTANELVAALDEELARLPDRYRGPLVLCCLEGLSRDEAARRLGVSTPTLNVQLERGRDRLQAVLRKRGIDLGVALLAVLVAPVAAVAQQRVVELVLRAAAGGAVPPAVAALIQGGTAVTKVKLMVALALVAGALATVGAAGFAARPAGPVPPAGEKAPADEKQPQPSRPAPRGPTPPKRVADKAGGALPVEGAKTLTVQGRVLGPDGKPTASAQLWLVGEGEKPTSLGTTAADGRFSVTIPGKRTGNAWSRYLVARAEAAGVDFLVLGRWKTGEPVELRLVKDNVVRGQVVSTEGKPVPGVHVFPEEINVHIDNTLDTFLAAYLRLLAGGKGLATLKSMRPGRGAPFGTTTDAAGRFTLRGIGAERTARLHLHGGGIADTTVQVANRAGFKPEPYNKAFRDHFIAANQRKDQPWMSYWMLSGADVKVVAMAEKVIRGVVKDADTGKGRPGLVVQLAGDSDGGLTPSHLKAKTDGEGRYEIRGARKAKSYRLLVASDPGAGYMPTQKWADDTTGYQPVVADLKVKKGVVITGKVIDRATGRPVPGWAAAAVLKGNPFAKDYSQISGSTPAPVVERSEGTDADGTFRLVSIPGPVLLMGGPDYQQLGPLEAMKFAPAAADPRYPQYFPRGAGTADGFGPQYLGLGGQPGFVDGHFCKVLEIKAGVPLVKQDVVLERAGVLTVNIQDAEGRPLTGAWAAGVSPRPGPYEALRIEKGSCPVYGLKPGKARRVVFCDAARKLARALTLKGDEKGPLTVKLGPAGALKGRLVDATGKPLRGIEVDVRYRDEEADGIEWALHGQKPVVTDAEGRFTLDALVPGLPALAAPERQLELQTRGPPAPTRRFRRPLERGPARPRGRARQKYRPPADRHGPRATRAGRFRARVGIDGRRRPQLRRGGAPEGLVGLPDAVRPRPAGRAADLDVAQPLRHQQPQGR